MLASPAIVCMDTSDFSVVRTAFLLYYLSTMTHVSLFFFHPRANQVPVGVYVGLRKSEKPWNGTAIEERRMSKENTNR